MSFTNFIPTVWAANLLASAKKAQVFANVVNRDFQGEISGPGSSVKINSIGSITVGDYDKSTPIDVEELSFTDLTLAVDQAKYFAFKIDDVDAAQAAGNAMPAAMDEAAYSLSDTADQYIASLTPNAGIKIGDGTPIDVNSSSVEDFILSISEKLDEANCPEVGRFLIVPPKLATKIRKAKIAAERTTDEALNNGVIGRYAGFDIRVSNNVPVSTGVYDSLAGTTASISYAEKLMNVEAFRPENSFSDAVKGLHVYGAKVVRPDLMVSAKFQVAEE